MQTTCPECRTTFRVNQEHLGLRRGLVRCGHCNAVFNAYDTLLAELEAPPKEAVHEALAEPWDSPVVPDAELEAAPADGPEPGPEPERIPEPLPEPPEAGPGAGRSAADDAEAGPPLLEALVQPPSPGLAPEAVAETSESILLAELPTRLKANRSGLPWWRSLLLWSGALLLILTLLAQMAYFFRADLAAAYPGARPVMNDLCQPLGCVVPLPHGLSRQAIVASSLEHDNEQKSRVRLTILIANRTGQVQAWPHLDLSLSDVRDAPVAHTLFSPASYLPKGTDISAGMAADSEKEIRLELDVGNLAPSGYSVNLVYP
jgi:predicted Zn finger-like uncharacterized protein